MVNVLIIDDDPNFSAMLREQLEELGFAAGNAVTLTAGKSEAKLQQPEVIFLDVKLPDGIGLGAIDELKAIESSPEVIIITGAGESNGAALAIESGAWDYLQKGTAPSEMLLSLNHALDYRRERLASVKSRALDLVGIIGNSQAIKGCYDVVAQASGDDNSVLIMGATGTGKELFARAIHVNSKRAQKPFIVVDCAALPERLVEATLFGHCKGAFTGADRDRDGLVRQANEGTLFLDEVGEMPLGIQKTFLRVLQEKCFRPVGGLTELASDFRVIAATNRNLDDMVDSGQFRSDLLYRIRGHVTTLPPLSQRGDDVVEIAKVALARICKSKGVALKGATASFFETIRQYSWPGNARELILSMERAVSAAADHQMLHTVHLPTAIRAKVASSSVIDDNSFAVNGTDGGLPDFREARRLSETSYLMDLMSVSGGDVEVACEISKLSRSRLYALLKQYGIEKPQ
jgi:two-component system NtrC family response regulator